MSSDTSSSEDTDPETARENRFEEILKKRIFLSDRIEKMEKVLINLNLVSKDTTFCADFELFMFTDETKKEETQETILGMLINDTEDIWFDLYRSITSNKENAEKIVEK